MAAVALVGTLDTKGPDFAFLAGRLRAAGAEVIVVDTGTGEPDGLIPDIDGETVAAAAGTTRAELRAAADRGRAVTEMGRGAAAVVADLVAQGRVGGVLGAGGSGGSSIAAQVMAGLPIGLPKLLVSTMASGDVSPYVGAKDVCVMYSVVDVAGINRISRLVLGNAAAAMAGMVAARARAEPPGDDRPLIAASMFGVTTLAVEIARARLTELGYEVLVFHATGAGGRALEALAEARLVSGVLDLTTTELADDLVGGVLSAGPGRATAAGAAGVPQVIAPGALDMVNFGPPATVPGQFGGRLFFEHNPTVTLMRTTAEEMAELGARIGRKAAAATGPAEVFWPERGISALDAHGQPFWDPDADAAGLEALNRELSAAGRAPRRVDAHVNDPEFATAMADRLHQMIAEGASMARGEQREELLARLRAKVAAGRPVIGAGAGTGLSAKCAEAGGADLIIIYNSGRYRMAGRGSLAGLMPYGDANAIVMEMAGEVLPVVRDVPVLAGVCGTDPFRLMPRFLDELAATGFAGVQNFPTVGLIDGVFRQNLEETGMSYDAEVEMIRLAAERGHLTCPYVFDPGQAEQMARAGADILVPHMGLTTSGTIGAQTALTLDDAVGRVQAMRDAAVAVKEDILVLCHGGPIAEPRDAGYVLARTTGVCGFFGASSMERLPVERALTAQVRAFTELSLEDQP